MALSFNQEFNVTKNSKRVAEMPPPDGKGTWSRLECGPWLDRCLGTAAAGPGGDTGTAGVSDAGYRRHSGCGYFPHGCFSNPDARLAADGRDRPSLDRHPADFQPDPLGAGCPGGAGAGLNPHPYP